MSENYKIMTKFIKDISGETPDVETYIYAKDLISKYQLNIEINSKPLKTQIVEINTMIKFHDNTESKKKAHWLPQAAPLSPPRHGVTCVRGRSRE